MTDTLPSNTAYELNPDALLAAYRTMRTIREFEERVHEEFATGEIPASSTCTRVRRPRRRASASTWTTAMYSPAPTAATATASPKASIPRR